MKLFRHLYVQVLVAIFIGGLIGQFFPNFGIELKIFGDAFINLIKMLIGPVIFCTVVLGFSSAGDIKKVGRIGGKALLYFEVVSTFALAFGLILVNWLKPGAGFNANPAALDAGAVTEFTTQAQHMSFGDLFLHLIPKTFFDAFTAGGDLLQILVIAVIFGYALTHVGATAAAPIHKFIESANKILFKMVNVVMAFAPIGAGGAMAFTIGRFGLRALQPMMYLMGTFYLACILFIVIVLGLIAKMVGFNIFRFIVFIRDELLTVLGTSSSESALAPMMERLEELGCSKSVVGLVVPAGYSFNLDGTNIYLTMAAMFVAQAMNINLSLEQQLSLLLIATLTSKGASGVTGAGFVTLAATLTVVPSVPVAGLALILGVDRFMSEARALTNTIGNGVATIVISSWENELDLKTLRKKLAKGEWKTSL